MLSSVSEVIDDFKNGKMVIIVDDVGRENEGDLALSAECVTPEALAFMMYAGRGLICASISPEIAERLNLPPQTEYNLSSYRTPFTVSIDLQSCAQTGVTATSRAKTIHAINSADSVASDFVSPGHVFPLVANPAGVMGRRGQTEGSFDLARLAGHKSAAVICEILNPDGTLCRGMDLNDFAFMHGLKITSIEDILKYRVLNEVLVRRVACSNMSTDFGPFTTYVYENDVDNKEHLALVYYNESVSKTNVPLVRLHSECLTGDVFGSRRCDCGIQLEDSMARIVESGFGAILYLRQEGRGIGLGNKLRAYQLQDQGRDTVEANIELGFAADQRNFAVAAQMLLDLDLCQVRLLTNNPDKVKGLEASGIQVIERVATMVVSDPLCQEYLATKRLKLGHLL
ncbi:MAG: GTP cyclohydrolase II [Bdellovibrionales bacterium]|nr:GTP cyclohydrolase II [Bdellovibrionales bacterium]